ncbi:MAG: RNA methyltransferase [Bacteroidota bacterium]|nr:RNA methyltransferase [Bacteroidota bacterium]
MLSKSKIKFIRSLRLKKNRVVHQKFIVEGEKIVNELIDSDFKIYEIFALQEWIDKYNCSHASLCKISRNELKQISLLRSPNQVLVIVGMKESFINSLDLNNKLSLVLDNIQDPGNLGAIIRTCDWFGIRNIICSKDTVDIFNSKVIQSTMGSFFRVQVQYKDLVEFLQEIKDKKLPIYISCTSGKNISLKEKYKKNGVIIIGNESQGVSSRLQDFSSNRISIENIGESAESLNAASATAILLHVFCTDYLL